MVYPHSYRTEHTETYTTNAMYGDYYKRHQEKKIKIQPQLLKIIQYVDSNHPTIKEDLAEAVAIKGVSGMLEHRDDLIAMVKLVEKWMVAIQASHECFYIGYHELDGEKVRMPPVILGTVKAAKPGSKTVCVYAHIDVKDPDLSKWESDPWTLDERKKTLYGNGVVMGKGPLICWFHTILAFRKANVGLPVNVKFIIEAMHNQRSEGLKDFLMTQKQTFLFDIDYIIVCESEWLSDKYPCLTYGCVGILHFSVTISKTEGGGDIREDLKEIFKKVVDKDNNILVPHFGKTVTQITPDEEQLFEKINFDMEEFRKYAPPEQKNWSKTKLLMSFWRLPSIFVDDIEECSCNPKDDSKIKVPFVIKIVPKQNAETCVQLITKHIKKVVKELEIKNNVEVDSMFDTRPWLEDCTSATYEAARRATIQIYKEDPSMIREDRDYRCINILQMVEKSILLLPLGTRGSNGGGDNEQITNWNLFEGIKLLGAYLFQIAQLAGK